MQTTNLDQPLEALLRPPVEWYSSATCLFSIVALKAFPEIFWLPSELANITSAFLLLLATWRGYQGYQILRYQRHLKAMPSYALHAAELPIQENKLFLGKGFQWQPIHTQRLRDLDLSYNQGYVNKAVNGHPHIHGVLLQEQEIFIDLIDRASHMLVLGLPGMGKTRFAENLIAQDIRRGDVVIVLDPKGDQALLARIQSEAKLAGRESDVRIFHLGFPKTSCRYNPIAFFTKLTQVATRITNALPSSGEAAAFREFAWKYVNLVTRGLVAQGITPTYRYINFYLTKLDVLFDEVMALALKHDAAFHEYYEVYGQKQKNAASNDHEKQLAFAEHYFKTVNPQQVQQNPLLELVNHLMSACRLDRTYYDKITASVGPLLEKLTSGEIAALLSPNYADIEDDRPILDLLQVIREKQIVYVGMDALTDPVVASAVGNAFLSDLVAVAGHLYKFGLSENYPKDLADETLPRIYLHADEFNEIIGDEFIPLLNKARGAGFSVTAYTQTWSDVEARLVSAAKANQTAGNLGTLIMFRCKGDHTLNMLLEDLPKVPILRTIAASSSSDNPHGSEGTYFQSSNEDRLTYVEMPLINQNDIVNLSRGEAFALLQGGKLYKLRMPLPLSENATISKTPNEINNAGDLHTLAIWIDCSKKQFEQVYLATLSYMRQQLEPLCQQHQLSYEALLQQQLQLAIAALKLRKGAILSGHFLSVEQMASEMPQWTYSVFLAALLLKANRYFLSEVQLKPWDKMIPITIQTWLSENVVIARYLNSTSDNNPIIQLVREAQTLITQRMFTHEAIHFEEKDDKNIEVKQKVVLQTLLHWLTEQNKETMITIAEGLLLTKDMLHSFVKTQHLANTELLVKTLKPYFFLHQDHLQHQYRSNFYIDNEVLEGIVIARNFLTPELSTIPINKNLNLNPDFYTQR